MKKFYIRMINVIVIIISIIPFVSFAESEELNISFVYTNTGVTAQIDGTAVASTEQSWVGVTSGDGFSLDGTTVTIDKAGKYTFKGFCKNGNIFVPKGEGQENRKIEIVLAGLNLTEPDEGQCPIEIKGGTNRIEITAKDGTSNTLADANHNESSPKACINASKKIELKGRGKLIVNGNNKNGIKSDTKICVKNLNLKINSVGDGIKADEELKIESGNLTINSGDDGIKSDNSVLIGVPSSDSLLNPNINIQSCFEGIEAMQIDVFSGEIKVHSNDDGFNAAKNSDNISEIEVEDMHIDIYDGNIYIEAGNDGIDSNGTISLLGGNISIFIYTPRYVAGGILDCNTNRLYINGATIFAADFDSLEFYNSVPSNDSQKYYYIDKRLNAKSTHAIIDAGIETQFYIPIKTSHIFYSSPTLIVEEKNTHPIQRKKNEGETSQSDSYTQNEGFVEESTANANKELEEPTTIIFKSPTVKKLTTGKKSFTITWKKDKNVAGYQLQYSTSKTFKKSARVSKTISKTKTSYKAKSLKAGKRYYVRMRGYKLVDGKKKYGGWSEVEKVRTK